MTIKTTLFTGLTFNVLVEEFNDRDAAGHLSGYLASVYTQDKATTARRLVRRSRLPGAADAMRGEIERDGIQAFRRLSRA